MNPIRRLRNIWHLGDMERVATVNEDRVILMPATPEKASRQATIVEEPIDLLGDPDYDQN